MRPGDAVFADENGVLILDPVDIEWAATRAIALQQEEKKTLARIDADIVGSTVLIETALAQVDQRLSLTVPGQPARQSCIRTNGLGRQ